MRCRTAAVLNGRPGPETGAVPGEYSAGRRPRFTLMSHSRYSAWAALGLLLAVGSQAQGQGRPLCRFADNRIDESSGVACPLTGDYFFTHNDSGDRARFFAVNRAGQTLAVFRVPGAEAVDWEDMARGPGEGGKSALYLGDIGDNDQKRATVQVYRVPEPPVDPARRNVEAATAPAVRYDFRYPEGPQNAESLLVHPVTGRIYLVTKDASLSYVYAAPVRLTPGKTHTLQKIGAIDFGKLPSPAESLSERLKRLLATGAAFSRDGKRIIVRSYLEAYEWNVSNGDVAAALKKAPTRIGLTATSQGEAITYVGNSYNLLITSEGKGSPVYELAR